MFSRFTNQIAKVSRGFATKSHAPPKKLHGTTGRYASALYTAASKEGVLDKVETEVSGFVATLKNNAAFSAFMMNPTVARSAKTEQIDKLLDDKTFSFVSKNLFLTLSANGRIADVEKVVNNYIELMEASRGETKVTITTAEPLNKKALGTVETAVKGMVGKGTKISITTTVDPAILGGLQVLVGDKFLDLSVQSRVQTLASELETAEL